MDGVSEPKPSTLVAANGQGQFDEDTTKSYLSINHHISPFSKDYFNIRGLIWSKIHNKCPRVRKFWNQRISASDKINSEISNYVYNQNRNVIFNLAKKTALTGTKVTKGTRVRYTSTNEYFNDASYTSAYDYSAGKNSTRLKL